MEKGISYTRHNLPELSQESQQKLTAIKSRAAIRKAQRIAEEERVNTGGHDDQSAAKKAVIITPSRKSKLISVS